MKLFFCLLFLPLFTVCQSYNHLNDSTFITLVNSKIKKHSTQFNKDSLLYYYQQRIEHFKAKDNIQEYIYGYCYDIYYDICNMSAKCILPYLEQAELNIWRDGKNKADSTALLTLYRDLGFHLMNLGHNIPKARRALEQAKSILDSSQITDTISYNIVFKSLGNVYTILGDNERAIRHFKNGLDHPIFSDDNKAGNYINLAIAYWNIKEPKTSIQILSKGLKIENLSQQRRFEFYDLFASNYLLLGDLETAQNYANLVLENSKTNKSKASVTYKLANILLQKGSTAQAEKTIKKSLSLRVDQKGRTIGKCFVTLGNVYKIQQKWLPALEAANDALSAVLPSFLASDQFAMPTQEQLYSENTILEALELKAAVFHSLYLENNDSKYLTLALNCYTLALHVEQLLRHNYLYESSKLDLLTESKQRAETAINLALKLSKESDSEYAVATAFRFAENTKSVVLADAIRQNKLLSDALLKDSLVQRERELYAQKIIFEQELANGLVTESQERKNAIASLNQDLLYAQIRLFEKHPAYMKNRKPSDPSPNSYLDQKSALLEFFYGDKHVYLFLHTTLNTYLFNLGSSKQIDSIVQPFLHFFSSKDNIDNAPKAFQKAAFQVCSKLLPAEIRRIIKQKTDLVIIPDGNLNFIPFESLVTSDKEWINLEKVDYLINTHHIRYAYSLNVLSQQITGSSQSNSVLAMAPIFPNHERGQFPLNHSKSELSVFNNPLLGQNATLAAFQNKADKSNIIHLSTHAKIDTSGQPRIEFIDQTLFLQELYTLKLQADLVVLSACETGIGQLKQGEGLMSLGRGFAYAGASSLIASLWSVQDASTSWIIDRFYKNIKKGLTKSKALHKAKLAYLSETNFNKSPYYWSVLSYIGADDSLELPTKGKTQYWFIVLGLLFTFLVILAFYRKTISNRKF